MNTNCRKNDLPGAGGHELNQGAQKFHHAAPNNGAGMLLGSYNSLPERGHLPVLNKTLEDKKKSPYQSSLGKERTRNEDFHMHVYVLLHASLYPHVADSAVIIRFDCTKHRWPQSSQASRFLG